MEGPKLVVISGGKRPEPAGDYIHQVFGDGGFLAKQIPGYRPRLGQIQLARAIDLGIREGRHVIGEGPTGTGKSLAYSVPAVYHAMFSGLRVCIITANKNLQRQIYQKDLADLAKAVPWQFRYAIRKGHASYLCLRNHDKAEWRDLLFSDPDLSNVINDTAAWADETETGDFEDSPGPPPKVWSAFSTAREDCDGKKCRQFEQCFAKLARDRAQDAHIVVTNYHLFFMHLKFGPESMLLPPFDVVIMDEAHNAAGIARDFFGSELTWGAIYRCVTQLHMIDVRGFKAAGTRLRDEVMTELSTFWRALAVLARTRKHILSVKEPIPSEPLEAKLTQVAKLYTDVAAALQPEAGLSSLLNTQRGAEAQTFVKLAAKCREKAFLLAEFRQTTNEQTTYFIEGSGNEDKGKYVKLKSKAIEVGGYLRRNLFERFPTVVQTSATLAVRGSGGSPFNYLRREMGMNKIGELPELEAEEIVVESPFNWPRQAMLVIPQSMPEPTHGSDVWDLEVCAHFERVVNAVGGRTLGLFTSYRMLQKAADHLRRTTAWRILVQGEATNRELVEQFQSDVASVLLGTESFSEGVSIEGEACTCVVLDKIPFLQQDDPIVQALDKRLKARGGRENVFQTYMLPEAIISFKQRVGRLIRTITDVGVVVVLDKRLITKGYRRQFLNSIPQLRTETTVEAIAPFLAGFRR